MPTEYRLVENHYGQLVIYQLLQTTGVYMKHPKNPDLYGVGFNSSVTVHAAYNLLIAPD
jgi:hypothetical protein